METNRFLHHTVGASAVQGPDFTDVPALRDDNHRPEPARTNTVVTAGLSYRIVAEMQDTGERRKLTVFSIQYGRV